MCELSIPIKRAYKRFELSLVFALEQILKQDSKIQRDERNKGLNGDSLSLPAQARQHAPAAIAELVRIIENTRSDAARLAALCILFDRGLGKPPKPLGIAIKDRVRVQPTLPPREVLEQMAELSKQGLDEALLELQGRTAGTLETEGES